MAFPRILLILLVSVAVALSVGGAADAAKKKKKKLAPGDVEYSANEESREYPPVIFPHWRHIVQYRCYVCHSELFEMEQSVDLGELMHKIDRCGSCHDGMVAFDIGLPTCYQCHIVAQPDPKKKKKKKKKADKEQEDG